jgi:hypothetical protein
MWPRPTLPWDCSTRSIGCAYSLWFETPIGLTHRTAGTPDLEITHSWEWGCWCCGLSARSCDTAAAVILWQPWIDSETQSRAAMPLPKGGAESDRSAEQTHTKQRHISKGECPFPSGKVQPQSNRRATNWSQRSMETIEGDRPIEDPGPRSPSGGVMCESVESYLCGTRVQPLPVRTRIWNGNAKATNQSSLSSQCVLQQPRA